MRLALRSLWALLLGLLAVGPLAAATIPSSPIAATLSSQWTTVRLPDTPLGITVYGGHFWVCGANEMIAESSDGGRTWRVLHEKRGGEMLFAVAFGGHDPIQAFGSAGLLLASRDGGAHWKSSWMAPARALSMVQFASSSIGYGFGPSGFAMTHDGGRSWHFWKIHSKEQEGVVLDMAVSDAKDAAFLTWNNRLVLTRDGGRSWQIMPFGGKVNWSGLEAVAGKFRLFGDWQGAVHVASAGDAASDSPIAALPSAWEGYNCNDQGCLVDGGWTDTDGGHWALPSDAAHRVTSQWSVVGPVACRVSDVLRCRTGHTVLAPPVPSAAEASTSRAACDYCPAPAFPYCHAWRGCTGSVLLRCFIGADGRVHAVVVAGAEGAGLAQAAEAGVRKWRYKIPDGSALKNGFTTIVEVTYHPPGSGG